MSRAAEDITPLEAVARIRDRLNVSEGKAQKILSEAWASGEVRRSLQVGGVHPVSTTEDIEYPGKKFSWSDLECWLDEHYAVEHHADPDRTGEPGRPTKSRDIYLAEFERRLQAGETANSVTAEARHLRAWLKLAHRTAAQPQQKTVVNRIRDRFREATSKRPKK